MARINCLIPQFHAQIRDIILTTLHSYTVPLTILSLPLDEIASKRTHNHLFKPNGPKISGQFASRELRQEPCL